jgi:non-ribosomal peptide synthase protein (TIGR01720 family)
MALVQACAQWTGQTALAVDLEGHGREALGESVGTVPELSRTVGWCTALYPVVLDLGDAWGPGDELTTIKEQLRAIPAGGVGYGLRRYLDPEASEELRQRPSPEVIWNYLGQLDTMTSVMEGSTAWRLSEGELAGVATRGAVASRGWRSHLLEIAGGVTGGCLRLSFTYSAQRHRQATIEALAAGFRQALLELIEHCLSSEAGAHSPSDFPEARLSGKDLETLFTQIRHDDET